MATIARVTSSQLRDARPAAVDAARRLREELGAEPDLVLVFASEAYDQNELLRGVREILPGSAVSGSSGEGVIHRGGSFETDYCVGLMGMMSDSIRFTPFLFSEYANDSIEAADRLADRVQEITDAFGVLVFPDGLTGNCARFLEQLDARLGPEPLILGGTAGDGMQMERTWQYHGETAVTGGVSGVVLSGAGSLTWAVSHGCTPVGLERTVTEASDGWIRAIDGQRAWDVFKEYLDGDPDTLNFEGIIHLCVGLPLSGEAAEEYGDYRIITPMTLDAESGALYFPGGGVETGDRVRLTRRDPEAIRESASACAGRVRETMPEPAFVLQFDCAGRGQALFGNQTNDAIVRPLQDEFSEEVPWLGFHTYGEIAPVAGSRRYHNYTVVLCGVSDAAR